MPILYILCGLPYSGKTLLSKEIEKTTDIKRVSFDEMFESFKISRPGVTYDEGRIEIEKEISRILKNGDSVVYDSTNKNAEHRDKLQKLASNVGADSVIVYLKTSPEEIQKRRKESLVDKTHHVLTEDFVREAIKKLEEPTDCVTISTEEEKGLFLKSLIK